MAYKVIKWLIIPFCVIFFMSHNVGAINFNFENYSLQDRVMRPSITCETSAGNFTGTVCSPTSQNTGNINVYKIGMPNRALNLKKGDLIETYLFIYTRVGRTLEPNSVINFNDFNTNSNLYLINIEQVSNNQFLSINSSYTDNAYDMLESIDISSDYSLAYIYKLTFYAFSDLNNYYFALDYGSTNGYLFSYFDYANSGSVSFKIPVLYHFKYEGSSEDEAAKKDLESTQNIEDQDTSDTPGGDNQEATNLIGNISGIFNQIKSIPNSSDCNVPANFGNLDLGNLNLCSGKENMSFIVNFGATVFQLVFVVGTGLILVRQVLNLYDWSRK